MNKFYPVIFITIFINSLSINLHSQIVNIPDPGFKSALVGDAAINTNLDAEIQLSEAIAFTGTIDASSVFANNFIGVEAFINIVGFDAPFNNVSSVDLSYNVHLQFIDISNNNLSVLDLSNNPELNTLYCSSNNLTCLDLSNNPAISYLNCANNNLNAINIKNGNPTGLGTMIANNNGIPQCIQIDPGENTAGFIYDTWATYNVNCGVPTASFVSNAPVCNGSPVVFNETSTLETEYLWNFGDGGTSSTPNPSYIYANSGSYMVTLIVGNCFGSDTVFAAIDQGTDIYGSANSVFGTVDDGFAVLYPFLSWYQAFDTLQISPLGPGGAYHFTNVEAGSYLIQVFPDSLLHPYLIPTYYTSHWAWDSSTVLNHGCTANTFTNIDVIELPVTGTGPGYIQGYVIEGPGFGRAQGDPVHGVVVKRGVTNSSIIEGSTMTNIGGEFEFFDVDYGNYTIYVDIPGLERDSCYEVVVNAANTQHTNLYYVVDSVKIYIVEGIGIEDIADNANSDMQLLPNPVRDNGVLNYAINVSDKVTIDIYNLQGVKVGNLLSQYTEIGEYSIPFNANEMGLKPGIYFITITLQGQSKTLRMIKV